MTDLPRKAVARTARLAALPLGYAGRSALGFGKRLGGQSAEAVMVEMQQRTAEQLFRTLGELKGGAMKFGQALSVLEAALPDEVAAPYRAHLTALQDSAPPMPTQTVRDQIEADLGPDWRDRLVRLDGGPTAAASIGQVHRGRWHDGREVAVKVQYPGAGDALLGDLRQLALVARGIAPVFPGIDILPLVRELQERAADELDYQLEAEAQQAFADAFTDDPRIVVPRRRGGGLDRARHRVDGQPRVAGVGDRHRHPRGTRPLRRAAGALPVLRPGPHRHAARRPAPGELPAAARTPTARPGGWACSTSGRSPGCPSAGCPRRWVACCGSRRTRPRGPRRPAAATRASSRRASPSTRASSLDYLAPFAEPTRVERFRFSREWMRTQFERINNPRDPSFTIATKLNLPPSYLLIHRTWLGGIGLLSQLEAEAPFRAILEESLPGFADA